MRYSDQFTTAYNELSKKQLERLATTKSVTNVQITWVGHIAGEDYSGLRVKFTDDQKKKWFLELPSYPPRNLAKPTQSWIKGMISMIRELASGELIDRMCEEDAA